MLRARALQVLADAKLRRAIADSFDHREMIDFAAGFASGRPQSNQVPISSGRAIEVHLPSYRMPRTRKHAAAYFVAPELDVLDLFIGSEGTLGVIVEIEVKLIPKPGGLMSAVVFFDDERNLLTFVREVRRLSLLTREEEARTNQTIMFPGKGDGDVGRIVAHVNRH